MRRNGYRDRNRCRYIEIWTYIGIGIAASIRVATVIAIGISSGIRIGICIRIEM